MRFLLSAIIVGLVLTPSPSPASQPDTSSMKDVFSRLKTALDTKNEKLFAKQFVRAGYLRNLVGGSGIAGRKVYSQGTRKGWYLKPMMAKLRGLPGRRGGPWIVPCQVWSNKRNRSLDQVFVLLVHVKGRSVVLGGGEKLREVEALGQRWVAKKPLTPPKRTVHP